MSRGLKRLHLLQSSGQKLPLRQLSSLSLSWTVHFYQLFSTKSVICVTFTGLWELFTCYSLSLQYEALPAVPRRSMRTSSQRRGSSLELCARSLPSPLHFLLPAQHCYVSVLGRDILQAFIPEAESARGIEAAELGTSLCIVPIKADTQ